MSAKNPEERIKVDVVSGVNGSVTPAEMTVTGIAVTDLIVQIVDLNGASSAEVAFTNGSATNDSDVIISQANKIKTDLNLSSKKLLVVWLDRSAG